jgi:hypothetical protein
MAPGERWNDLVCPGIGQQKDLRTTVGKPVGQREAAHRVAAANGA